jgi:hypothetical protein
MKTDFTLRSVKCLVRYKNKFIAHVVNLFVPAVKLQFSFHNELEYYICCD